MSRTAFDGHLAATKLAFRHEGSDDELGLTGFFWLGGYKSTMLGSKAEALAELAAATRRRALRFDYSGHGESSGFFIDGSISLWLEQATHMFLTHTKGRRILVGSSMGGWLALLLIKRLREQDPSSFKRIRGLVLIAPATDMTKDLMWDQFDVQAKLELEQTGVYLRSSDYGEPYTITAKLLADGQNHLLFPAGLDLPFPVRILQGSKDHDVPPSHGLKTFEALRGPDVSLILIKDGDHRLSSPSQLQLIKETALRLAERADGERL